jgi:hypothetical protein
MWALTHRVLSGDGSCKDIRFRNDTLLGIEMSTLVKMTAVSVEPGNSAVVEKEDLKICVNAEKNIVGFDWRLCLDGLLLHPGKELK